MPTPTQAQTLSHTPTPWRAIVLSRQIEHEKPNQLSYPIKPVNGNFLIASVTLAYPVKDGNPNVLDYAQGEANAAFIVTACNEFERIRAENKALRSFAESVAAWCIAPDKSPESFAHFEQQARAALSGSAQ